MAWLANDFAQERLWKMTAAAQICRRVAFTSRLKFEEKNWKHKKISSTLANAVMDFWHSTEVLNSKNASLVPKNCGHDLVGSRADEVTKTTPIDREVDVKEDQEHNGKNNGFAIRDYALRYLKYNSSPVPSLLAEAPATPDRVSDLSIMDISWDEYLTEHIQDLKQIVPVHNSHVIALSQVCPNNLNGGVLSPLDLCDATASSQDVLPFGCQASHVSGLAGFNEGGVGSVLPASGVNSSLQGSPGMVVGSNLSSLSAPVNAAERDGRYGVPRTSLPADEQHRIQQYNQMLPGRKIQQSNLSLTGAVSGPDRGVRMLPAANGMGLMSGINRSLSMSRTGFRGMASSAMLNSGSMLSSNMAGMPSPVKMHPGPGPGQDNSMLRPHDTTHMMQPGHHPEHQRKLMVPELQMQSQGNSQGIPAFNGLTSSYPNHPQQQQQMPPQKPHALGKPHHATGSQQQVYAMRLAKERQMQLLQQQQTASSTLMPHVQPQTQLPIPSLQNSSQIHPQASNQTVSLPLTSSSPMTPISKQNQQKLHLSPHGLGRNPQLGASGLNTQIGKQQQSLQQQQFQQSSRHHPQQRQQMQSKQQAKPVKGVGIGLMHQNLSADLAHLNGVGMIPGNQGAEKGEHMMQAMQGHSLYSGPGVSPVQPSKPLVSSQPLNNSQPLQKLMSGEAAPSTKQLKQMSSHSDTSSQGQVSPVPSGHIPSAVHQSLLPAALGSEQQHLQLQSQLNQKQANQKQPSVEKMLQLKQVNSDSSSKSQDGPAQAGQQLNQKQANQNQSSV